LPSGELEYPYGQISFALKENSYAFPA
jgi:hypothetical protein